MTISNEVVRYDSKTKEKIPELSKFSVTIESEGKGVDYDGSMNDYLRFGWIDREVTQEDFNNIADLIYDYFNKE